MDPFRSVYIAFDPHPSFKGASTHITEFSNILSRDYFPMLLLTLKGTEEPVRNEFIYQECFTSASTNMLERALSFSKWVKNTLAQHRSLVLAHFRDIWGGMAVLDHPHLMSVYEVNALPSIELPYRYPMLADDTLAKIRRLENYCLSQSMLIVTPSHTTSSCLQSRGVPASKLNVVPNGAHVPLRHPRRTDLPDSYFVYVGALQPWQGLPDLFRALRYLDDVPLPLVICCGHAQHLAKPLQAFADQLGVTNKIMWLYECTRDEVDQVLQHALFSVAPLTECSRNVEQGCAPLKVIESMANGTPVIASRVPPILEIMTHQVDGILCRPGRPADLARNIRLAFEDPKGTASLGVAAKHRIDSQFTWKRSGDLLRASYESIATLSY